ncbi:MAG: sugar phosphate isomerase/epimerase [Smithellaceae bacterium]|nr:sugar phosphate isomerase/epimerase [Smithellaceae bacterium]
MKLGYSTNAFVKGPLKLAAEAIAELGFGGIEIMGDRPHLYPPDWGGDKLAELKALIDNLGLHINNINSFTLFAVGDTYLPSWIEIDKKRRGIRIDHTLQCLMLAAKLGARNISVPPGGPLQETTRKQAMHFFYEGLEKVLPLAEELGVKVLVEPEPELLLENSVQFKEFIADIRSPFVGLNFDIGHFFCAGEEPAESFQELYDWIGHIHLEDIGADRRHYHLIPGQGAIALPGMLRTIAESGYKGDISLELYTYADRPAEAGRISLAYLMPLLEEAGFDPTEVLGPGNPPGTVKNRHIAK